MLGMHQYHMLPAFFLPLLPPSIPFYDMPYVSVCSSAGRQWGHFHLLVIVSNATVNSVPSQHCVGIPVAPHPHGGI